MSGMRYRLPKTVLRTDSQLIKFKNYYCMQSVEATATQIETLARTSLILTINIRPAVEEDSDQLCAAVQGGNVQGGEAKLV